MQDSAGAVTLQEFGAMEELLVNATSAGDTMTYHDIIREVRSHAAHRCHVVVRCHLIGTHARFLWIGSGKWVVSSLCSVWPLWGRG